MIYCLLKIRNLATDLIYLIEKTGSLTFRFLHNIIKKNDYPLSALIFSVSAGIIWKASPTTP